MSLNCMKTCNIIPMMATWVNATWVNALAQASFLSAATIAVTSKSTIVSKPKCCYKCAGCYDKSNQQRYSALTALASDAASSQKAVCKPTTKCPILNGVKMYANGYKTVVRFLPSVLGCKFKTTAYICQLPRVNHVGTGVLRQVAIMCKACSRLLRHNDACMHVCPVRGAMTFLGT
jgi:hypothetical protein